MPLNNINPTPLKTTINTLSIFPKHSRVHHNPSKHNHKTAITIIWNTHHNRATSSFAQLSMSLFHHFHSRRFVFSSFFIFDFLLMLRNCYFDFMEKGTARIGLRFAEIFLVSFLYFERWKEALLWVCSLRGKRQWTNMRKREYEMEVRSRYF